MLILISPAKTLDFSQQVHEGQAAPAFLEQTRSLRDILRRYSQADLAKLMKLSDSLAELNVQRYQEMDADGGGKAALWAFQGDVYKGIDLQSLGQEEQSYLVRHLRILSGFYGLLQPQDAIEAHRLEMGTRLPTPAGKGLYSFWGSRITEAIEAQSKALGASFLLNLASEEYSKAVDFSALSLPVYAPRFLEKKGGNYKVIAVHAKKARGLMCRYLAQTGGKDLDTIRAFDSEGYSYNLQLSEGETLAFCRG